MVKSTKFYQRFVRQRRARAQKLAELSAASEVASPPMGDDAEKSKPRKSNSKS